jgi:hypothetical protein
LGVRRFWTGQAVGVAGLLALLASGCAGAAKRAASPASPPQPYLRKADATNGAVALQTVLRAFAPANRRAPVVWLVAVTHLGTTNYYAELQQFLDAQSLVLFEGVGATNKTFELSQNEGYSLQDALAKAIGLEFQLNALKYSREHFRNSDLTLAQLEGLFDGPANALQTGEALSAAAAGAPASALPAQSRRHDELGQVVELMQGTGLMGGLARLGVAFLGASPRLQALTKVTLIELLGQVEGDVSQMAGLPPGFQRLLQVLVRERNQVVMRDVGAALRQRPRPRSVAVLYGAGHMAHLEQRLQGELGYRPVAERWLTAFAVDVRAAGLSAFELELTRQLVRRQLEALQSSPSRGANDQDPSVKP